MAKVKNKLFKGVDPAVFAIALAFVVIFCILGGIWPNQLADYASQGLNWVVTWLSWLFVLTSTGFIVFALALAISRYGQIPLSEDGEEPEFSLVSWTAMMFSAGMGIGLIFFGVFEPVAHLTNPAPWLEVQPGTEQAARLAMGSFEYRNRFGRSDGQYRRTRGRSGGRIASRLCSGLSSLVAAHCQPTRGYAQRIRRFRLGLE